jgi:hypothetical protein
MPHYQVGTLVGRGLPLRLRQPQPIPEDGSQHGRSPPSASSVSANNVRPPYDYGDSQSERNIPVSVTVMPDRHRNSLPNTHITYHAQYNSVPGPDGFSDMSQSGQPSSSPPEGPLSQNTFNSYYAAGDQIPAGAIHSAVNASPNTQHFSHPSTQQRPHPYISNLPLPRAATWHNSGYQGSVADSQSNSPRRNSEHEIQQSTSHQSIPQEILEGNEYTNDATFSNSYNDNRLAQGHAPPYASAIGSNQTASNRYPLADNYQTMPSQAEDPQAFDIQAGMNSLRVYEGENASYTASSNERLNEGLSTPSRTTTRSQSINSMSSTYSSPVSDENGPSSRPLNGLNDYASPTGIALRRSQSEYNTGMADDVGFDFTPLLS